MRLNTFSTKLISIVSASLILFSSILTFIIYHIIKNNLLLNLKTKTEYLIEEIKSSVYPTIDLLAIRNLITEVKKNKDIYYFALYDNNGNIIYFYLNPNSSYKPSVLEEKDLKKNKISLYFFSLKKHKNFLEKTKFELLSFYKKKEKLNIAEIRIPIFIHEKKFGMVQFGQQAKYLYATLKNELITIVSISFGLLIVTLIFVYTTLKTLTKPINLLSNVAEEISRGNLQTSVPIFHNSYEVYNLSMKMQQMVWGLRERETIKDIFGKYIDKKLVDKLLKEQNQLKGIKKEVVVFYIDMREFTKFTEQNKPEDVVSTLNKFFTIAIDAITKYGGIIDKLIGDAILAHFGTIETKKEDPKNAVMAALEFIDALEILNNERKKQNLSEIKAGITIHIGEVIVGNIGHKERMEFTIVGDAVNTASRMQLYNRQFNVPLLVTKELMQKISDNTFKFKFVSTVNIRGKTQPIELYTVEKENF
ncbi:MAG: adenylate/guanylate cyclase domain-containing protein [Endomicrobiia bacterium]